MQRALPPGGRDENVPVLDASTGGTVKMDALGPIVVNENGSLSRITNWDALSEREREVAKRRIAKRNKERLAALKASDES